MTAVLTALLSVGLTLACLAARVVDLPGALAGLALALVFQSAESSAPLVLFAGFVVLGSAASRLGRAEKERRGVAQEREGRRGAANAFANVAGAVFCLALGALSAVRGSVAEFGACTVIASSFGDTLSSELGTLLGGQPRLLLLGRRVPVGTDGGCSIAGTAAGLLGVLLSVAGAVPLLGIGFRSGIVLGACAFTGGLLDSILGATLQPSLGRAGGHWVNLLSSTSAGLLGMGATALVGI